MATHAPSTRRRGLEPLFVQAAGRCSPRECGREARKGRPLVEDQAANFSDLGRGCRS